MEFYANNSSLQKYLGDLKQSLDKLHQPSHRKTMQ